jgi:hypothetical protein
MAGGRLRAATDRISRFFQQRVWSVVTSLPFSILALAAVATSAFGGQPRDALASYDLVVLGEVDACWVCQFGPSPRVTYRRVLAGTAPQGKAEGILPLTAVAEKLLPEGVPMYRSRQEEISILQRDVVPGYESVAAYRLIDVMEATPENLARFPNR